MLKNKAKSALSQKVVIITSMLPIYSRNFFQKDAWKGLGLERKVTESKRGERENGGREEAIKYWGCYAIYFFRSYWNRHMYTKNMYVCMHGEKTPRENAQKISISTTVYEASHVHISMVMADYGQWESHALYLEVTTKYASWRVMWNKNDFINKINNNWKS